MNGFVLIDRLLELNPGTSAVATKTFGAEDGLFRDHFPGYAIVPGSLLIESMAQTAGWLVAATTGFSQPMHLVMVKDAKFRQPVLPDTMITLSAAIVSARGDVFEVAGAVHVSDEAMATARLVLSAFDFADDRRAVAFRAWARDTFRAIGGESLMTTDPCGS
jgi:3-hydroxyacyl-[acyl-carrier-protein] dehydratase